MRREILHLDEHGELRTEDVQRQEILERAGWTVLRVPYRSWRKDPAGQIGRIVAELSRTDDARESVEQTGPAGATAGPSASLNLSRYEAAIFRAVQNGEPGLEEVLKSARIQLGLARLGPRVRTDLEAAVQFMQAKGILSNEDHEIFLTEKYKNAAITTYRAGRATGRRRRSP